MCDVFCWQFAGKIPGVNYLQYNGLLTINHAADDSVSLPGR